MPITEVTVRPPELQAALVALWEGSVQASHHFLSAAQIAQIKPYVPQALAQVEHLLVAGPLDQTQGFMGITGQKLEMLFVAADQRGQGIGSALLDYGIAHFGVNQVVVNEQNPAAQAFYHHHGFRVYERHALDEQGQPYPILLMQRKN